MKKTLASNESESIVSMTISKYGNCVELIPSDPYFHNVSIGLYIKNEVLTVWTFSQKDGVANRLRTIRDQLISLGGLSPIDNTHNQLTFPCGYLHLRPVKFLLSRAVTKDPNFAHPQGDISIKDTKTSLILTTTGKEDHEQWIYTVTAQGEAANIPMRLRMVTAGFMRYGEMEKVNDNAITFSCKQRHDELIRILAPYSRNISAVENMLENESLRGQMTTNTLGFTPST